MNMAKAVAFDSIPDKPCQQGRDQQRGPEAEPSADLKSEEGTEHVEARMRKVEHAQHAEDDGQAARHQEQQHSVQHAVERGCDDQFKHDTPPLKGKSRIRPGRCRSKRWIAL
jgi:hypothetical protein